MATRITQRLMVDRSLTSLQTGLSRLATSQEHLSTGRLINRPSDSPTGTNDAMRLRAQMTADSQYAKNAQSGLDYLARTDSTLSSMVDNVQRARDLLVQGASIGSAGADARAALATEMTQIREALLDLANTEHMGRPLFGGTTSVSEVYLADGTLDPAVVANDDVTRTIGDGQNVAVNVTAPDAFSVGTDDLFTMLDDAIAALRTNPADATQIGAMIGRVDALQDQMLAAQADVGARVSRIEDAVARLADAELDHTAALSDIENVDIAKAVVDLQMQEVAYQAALGATARVLQPSLIDFLR